MKKVIVIISNRQIRLFVNVRLCSDEIMAVIKLDNQTVAQTSWRPCSQQAWDQRFENCLFIVFTFYT